MVDSAISPERTEVRPASTNSWPSAPPSSSPKSAATIVKRRPGLKESAPRKYKVRRRRIELTLGISLPIMLLVGWQLLTHYNVLTVRFFPTITSLWPTTANLFSSGTIEKLIGRSLVRIMEGFAMGVAGGLLFGILEGVLPLVRAATMPTVYALWMIPKLATLPLLLYFFGLNTDPIIVLIAVECMFLVLIPTERAVANVPEAYREAAGSFGASRFQLLRYVTIPAAMPVIFVSLRLAAGAAVLVDVAGEFVTGKPGIGFFIFNSYQLFDTQQMYVGIIAVSIIGTAFVMIITGVGQYITRWQRAG